MANGLLMQLLWRGFDRIDYSIWQARFWALDAVCGPEPEPDAEQWRQYDPERI